MTSRQITGADAAQQDGFWFGVFRSSSGDGSGAVWRFTPSDPSARAAHAARLTLNERELSGFCFPEPLDAMRAVRRARVAPSRVYCFATATTHAVEGQRKPRVVQRHGFCLRIARPARAAMGRRDLLRRAVDCLCFVVEAPPGPAPAAMVRLWSGLLHMAACVWLRGAREGPPMLQRLLDATAAATHTSTLAPASAFVLGKHMLYYPGQSIGRRSQLPLAALFGESGSTSFSVDAQLQLIAAALCERRIVFVSDTPWKAASCVHGTSHDIVLCVCVWGGILDIGYGI